MGQTGDKVTFPCGHTWCADCVAGSFEISYTAMWTIEQFPRRACCFDQPLGDVTTALALLSVPELMKCLEKHWAWVQRRDVDLEVVAAVMSATKDSQKCKACSNVMQRKDGCNHMM